MSASLAISGEATASGVTQFANEACDGVEILTPYKDTPYAVPQSDLQDLKSYFERPRLIRRGTVPFATRTRVNQFDASVANFTTAFPQWSNRLSGAYGIRFKTCFRLQVACTAFHQGVLALNWQYGSGSGDTDVYNRSTNSSTCTNLPHVRLDVSENTMVELSCPFLYTAEYMPISGVDLYNAAVGTLALNVVLPFVSVVGLNVPSYELYV